MLERISNQTELDIHIGSIHRKIPFSSCSCYGDVQENILDSCDSCDNNGDSLCIYRTELASSCNICWKTLKTEIELNTHMGSIHGMIISSSCSWNDNAPSSSSLYAAHEEIEIDCDIYCDVCDSISPVRDGLKSHKSHVLRKRVSNTCTGEMVSRPSLKLHEADRLTCDECNYKFELQSSLRRHERFGHKGGNYA